MKQKVSFSDLINSQDPVLVDFSAEWCGPCQAMGPVLKDVAKKIKDKAKIIKVDVDRNRKVASKYQITGVPTFILFKEGKVKWRKSGMQSAHQLQSVIEEHSN